MTDKESLLRYRFRQATSTLDDAKKMLKSGVSPHSIINRAYYAMFYSILALFLKLGINLNTSKHSGVILIFDKELIHTGKLDKSFSKMLHSIFELRQECDYREYVKLTKSDAKDTVKTADIFISTVRNLIRTNNKKSKIKKTQDMHSEE